VADQFLVTGDALSRTTNLVAASSDFTALLRFTPNTSLTAANYRIAFGYINTAPGAATAYTKYAQIVGTLSGGLQKYKLSISDGVTTVDTTTFTLTNATEYRLAYIRSGMTHVWQINDTVIGSVTLDLSGVTWAAAVLGGDGFSTGVGNSVTNLKLSYYREWAAALSVTEVTTEFKSSKAYRTANLVADTPLISDKLDISGNGNHWTDLLTASAFVNNTLPASSMAVTTFPYSRVVTQAEFNVANLFWFKVTPSTNVALGSFTTKGGTFTPTTWVYLSDGNTLVDSYTDVAFYNPMAAGDYYVKLTRSAGGASTFDFTTQFQTASVTTPGTVDLDSIVINDDEPGMPGSLWDVDGTLVALLSQVPGGELGASLPNGTTLWHDRYNNFRTGRLTLLSSALAHVATVDTTPALSAGADACCICANGTDFFVLNTADNTLWKVTSAGVISTLSVTVAPAVGIRAIGVNAAATICYYAAGLTAPFAIRAWDMVGNVALPTVYTIGGDVAAVAVTAVNGHNGEILVLNSGNVVTWYTNAAFTTYTVIEVTPAGALVSSKTFTGTYTLIDHLSYDSTATSIRVWLFDPASNLGQFVVLALGTGTVTVLFTLEMFNSGTNLTTAASTIFGPSQSCVMVSVPFGGSGPPGTATLIVIKMTVPPELLAFDYQTTGGLVPSTFSLANGESLTYADIAAGTYGVTEDVATNWATTYAVDNGDAHDAITLAEGETVTVTVTNTFVSAGGTVREYLVRRERWFPVISQEQQRLFFQKLQVDLQAGNGLTTGQGSAPLMEIDWSDDGGFTWSNIRFTPSGPLGQYQRRVIERMLGQSRSRVFRLAVSDPVQWIVVDGYMDLIAGSN
jgi:hypothetical protein